jgi:PAT family beta-lactamase induction signal transducer AmpG
MQNNKQRSPWAWIPSLYLIQGLPMVAVTVVAVIMYKRLGLTNTQIALYTGWLYLPWMIKPLWSPFVDMLKTKRWWIVTMQLLMGAAFAGIAFSIPTPFYIQATLAFFWLIAFSSATHDIAADGFYMLALDSGKQAQFVGIRSTFFRCAVVLGQGALVILAGFMESATGLKPLDIAVEASPQYTQSTMVLPTHHNFVQQEGEMRFITNTETLNIGTFNVHKDSVVAFLAEVNRLNITNGFIAGESAPVALPNEAEGFSDTDVALVGIGAPEEELGAFSRWIKNNFGKKAETVAVTDNMVGNVGVVAVWLSQKPESDRILDTNLRRGRDISLISSDRLVFNEHNWNTPAYMVFQLDKRLADSNTVEFRGLSGNIRFAWSITFFILAGLLILGGLYHRFILPKPDSDHPAANVTAGTIFDEFLDTFVSFFKKPGVGVAIFFMLTFRFAEAQLLALVAPFMLDSPELGGLGMTTGGVGLAYGTFGIIALTLGGIVGGIAASRGGLKKWLWPMTLSLLIPSGVFIPLAIWQPDNFFLISTFVAFEQFGYGFGFVAYMLFMIYFSEGKNKTAHYAICTGFMAMGMMFPRMWAGWLQELLGYENFFIWVMICSIIPAIAVAMLKIDPNFGKATKKKK